MLYDAALRNLQTLSEATQLLPEEKKIACPTIPWPEISGFRNILVHNYLGNIDPMTVALVIDKHLKPLEECIRAMLSNEGPEIRRAADKLAAATVSWCCCRTRALWQGSQHRSPTQQEPAITNLRFSAWEPT